MVIKHLKRHILKLWGFESSVNSYGNQTIHGIEYDQTVFESSVNSYGNQTWLVTYSNENGFESSVNSYGNQTLI